MNHMYMDESGRMILEDYTAMRPFSSFLPGIAGQTGIPMWVFYVNRGQAVASFGVESKDYPILEFQPANKAYRETPFTGFRTFLKVFDDGQTHLYEPFSGWQKSGERSQRMLIGMNELELEEHEWRLGIQTHVSYFNLPEESFAGLIRKVRVKNRSGGALHLELLDGLPAVIPFGVNDSALKEISRTMEAWMGVYNLDRGVPFYRLGASIEDSARVERIEAGHFAFSFCLLGGTTTPLQPIVDPDLIFGHNTALSSPDHFIRTPLKEMLNERQIDRGKTPCGFFGHSSSLAHGHSLTIYTLFGHIGNEKRLDHLTDRLSQATFMEAKQKRARALALELTDPIATKTGSPAFDAYCRQTFLDNVLRGGWPIRLQNQNQPRFFHIYSRKHGDLERDYNAFHLAPEPYSQGELNYRDVNQNRRCDVLFRPEVQDFNLRAFMSLIQADGYNPLVVKGVKFTVAPDERPKILAQVNQPEKIESLLRHPFSPGQLLKQIIDHEITLRISPEDFLASVLQSAEQDFHASFGEGYWVDHWTYNLDQMDSYLRVYPDRENELLFGDENLPFYDSPFVVRPRAEKYTLADGSPRQYRAAYEDLEKAALIASRAESSHWMRVDHGRGTIYRTSLFVKLVFLALIKFTTLDPYGMGVEMEAGKPGWYDALNGLPGLFGSSLPETYELLRLIRFLIQFINEHERFTFELPVETHRLMKRTRSYLMDFDNSNDPDRDFQYWDVIASAREAYRAEIRLGFAGAQVTVWSNELLKVLEAFKQKIDLGIHRALSLNNGFPPTYFGYEAETYENLRDAGGVSLRDEKNRPYVRVGRFRANLLPPFLEGAVKALKLQSEPALARECYQQIKASDLFDRKLKMYKVNVSLEDQPYEIGRARAFPPGWLENESIWLHMQYKLLWEVLKSGLYTEFFEEFRNTLVPFQDPLTYGRSHLENSSFIVSSAHPDESLHGAGFVARLSGSTAEFLSIWQHMMAGSKPFHMREGELCLSLQPILPGWLFDEDGTVAFTFLGQCNVVYHNPQRLDTFELQPHRALLQPSTGQPIIVQGQTIGAPFAEMVRDGQIAEIQIFLKKVKKHEQ